MIPNITPGLTGTSYDEFKDRLVKSEPARMMVYGWLRRGGLDAYVKPLRVRPRTARIEAYRDEGDIRIAGSYQRIEVKGLRRTFTGPPPSWPFDTVFVDSEYHVSLWTEQELARKLAWFTVSADKVNALIIEGDVARAKWRLSKEKNVTTHNYKARFWEIDPWDVSVWGVNLLDPTPTLPEFLFP